MLRTPSSAADIQAANPALADTGSDYLLVCKAHSTSLTEGTWHFSLEAADGSPVFAAGDEELGDLNRLTLLAAVRGLEAIDGPSAVTMLSNNRYLIRSLSDSLPRWRDNNFVWEHFGRRIDVQHADLWRRIDRALSIHRVEACLVSSCLVSTGSQHRQSTAADGESITLRVDSAHGSPARPHVGPKAPNPSSGSAQADQAGDQLRRWLLGGNMLGGAMTPRRRFTAADLMEAT